MSKAERKERSHVRILESAARLVREGGIAGARVADVMKGAGMTVGGFYAHFASKEALVAETLRRAAAENRARLFARIEEKPPEDRALVILKRYLSAAHRDAPDGGCPFPAVVGEVGTSAPEHAPVVADLLDELAAELGAHVPKQRALALGLVALMFGGLSLARAVRGTPLADEVLRSCRALGKAALE